MSDETKITSMTDLLEETGASSSDLDLTGTSSVPYDEELDSPIIGQQYLAKFHPLEGHETELEERESSIVSGVHFNTTREMNVYLEDGYEKISVDEQNALVDGKVRNITTKELVDRPPVVVSLESKKQSLLSQVNSFTEKMITGGFEFTVTSGVLTGAAYFDSSKEDQLTFSTMYNASQSPDFETTDPYNGYVPMRGRAITGTTEDGKKIVAGTKQVYALDKAGMQKFIDTLGLHIGVCKSKGWEMQSQVEEATEETWDATEAAIKAIIEAGNTGYVFEGNVNSQNELQESSL